MGVQSLAWLVLIAAAASYVLVDGFSAFPSLASSRSMGGCRRSSEFQQSALFSSTDDIIIKEIMDSPSKIDEEQRNLRFQGVGRLYVGDNLDSIDPDHPLDPHLQIVERLTNATVCVVGLGGVGSWAAEALCRSGVGNLILIDLDDICISNTNRQLHATSTTVGQMKIDEMRNRLLSINPDCNIVNIYDFISEDNVHQIIDGLLPDLDACLDCIDGSRSKTALLAACVEKGVPIVTVGGAAGRMDPTKIVTDDLTRVESDRLLSVCRADLRKKYGFAAGYSFAEQKKGKKSRKWNIPTVYSIESPKQLPKGETDKVAALRRCDGALGTACFVTGTFGFVASGLIVDMIANDAKIMPKKK